MGATSSVGAKVGRDALNLVLIGARSNAGRVIERVWACGNIVRVHRGDGAGISVTDYMEVAKGVISPGAIVVNCVGTPRGSEAELLRINRDVPLRWAEAALAAGASHVIQLSSFSVYGQTETVGIDTPDAPQTAYGRSKLAADQALLEVDGKGLPVTLLRIPMLFGEGRDKLARLVRAVLKTGFVPSLSRPIERSMLSYGALGAAVAHLTQHPIRGVVNVADPTVFTYELLRDRIAHVTGRRPRKLPVPRIATAASRLVAPAIHARLFASSRLEPSAALAFNIPAEATLPETIDRIVRAQR